MRTMIVDDEVPALRMLEQLVNNHEELSLVYATRKGAEVVEKVLELRPDLILLDINLGDVLGIELADEISNIHPEANIIFISAYSEYAVKAFDLNAIDYLLKPVTTSRFKQALKKLGVGPAKHSARTDAIRMEVFGEGRVQNLAGKDIHLRTKKAYEVLFLLRQYLKEGVTKAMMLEYMWADISEESATMILHTTIYQIRQSFKAINYKSPIAYSKGRYYLAIQVAHDLSRVEEILKDETEPEKLKELLALYKGPYFEKDHFQWALALQTDIHRRVLTYILEAIKKDQIEINDLQLVLDSYKEDFLMEKTHIETISHYYQRQQRYVENIAFIKEAGEFWQGELNLVLPKELATILKKTTTAS